MKNNFFKLFSTITKLPKSIEYSKSKMPQLASAKKEIFSTKSTLNKERKWQKLFTRTDFPLFGGSKINWKLLAATVFGGIIYNQINTKVEADSIADPLSKVVNYITRLTIENFDKIIEMLEKDNPACISIDASEIDLTEDQIERIYKAIENSSEISHIKFKQSILDNNIVQKIIDKCCNNILNFDYYPNDYIHGLISKHVYEDSRENETVTFKDNYSSLLKDWRVEKVYYDKNSGYYAALYKNPKTHQLILAHRGTEDILKDLIHTDLEGILRNKIVAQQAQAYKATEDAVRIARESHYRLSVTGHSLGARLATLSIYCCKVDFNYHKVRCVGFDSPGSFEMFEKFKPNLNNNENLIDIRSLDIVTYCSTPNFVNSCGKHVGQVYRVNNKIPITIPETAKLGKTFQDRIRALNTIIGHSLIYILDNFDENTGLPKSYDKMADWPSLVYENVTNEGIEKVSKQLIKIPLLDKAFAKHISKYAPSILVNVIGDFLNGNLKLEQYFNYFVYVQESDGKYKLQLQNIEEEFYSKYESHYKEYNIKLITEINDNDRIVLTNESHSYTSDWIIKKIDDHKGSILEQYPYLIKLLNKLIDYRVDNKEGTNLLYAISNSNVNMAMIKHRIERLLNTIPEIKEKLKKGGFKSNNNIIFTPAFPFEKNKDFSGRVEQLNEIKEYFDQDNNQIVILTGFGRAGKTSIALEYSYRMQRANKLVRWIDAEKGNIENSYKDFANALEIDIKSLNNQEIINAVNRKLFQAKKEIILIFDNVEEWKILEPYVKALHGAKIKYLITTRNELLKSDNIRPIKIESFNIEEAKNYLQKRLRINITQEEDSKNIDILIETLSSLIPGKLDLAASAINASQTMNIPKYIKKLETNNISEPEIDLSFKIIEKENKRTWELFQYLAFFDKNNVPINLLDKYATESELEDGIKLLKKYSLIKLSEEKDNISIHQDIQTELAKTVKDEQKVRMLEKLLNEIPFSKDTRARRDFESNKELLPHVNSLLKHFDLYRKSSSFIYENNINALLNASRLLGVKAYLDTQSGTASKETLRTAIEAKGLIEELLKISNKDKANYMTHKLSREDNNKISITYASILYTLGRIYFDNKNLISKEDAKKCFEYSRKISEEVGKYKDKPIFYKILAERAGLLLLKLEGKTDEIREAIKEYRELMNDQNTYINEEEQTQNLKTDEFHKSYCTTQIIKGYRKLTKFDPNNAQEYYKESLNDIAFLEKIVLTNLKDYERVANYLNTIGNFYVEKNNPNHDIKKAKEFFLKAYKIEKAKNFGKGKKDYPLADSCTCLTKIFLEENNVYEALKLVSEEVEIREKLCKLKNQDKDPILEDARKLKAYIISLLKNDNPADKSFIEEEEKRRTIAKESKDTKRPG